VIAHVTWWQESVETKMGWLKTGLIINAFAFLVSALFLPTLPGSNFPEWLDRASAIQWSVVCAVAAYGAHSRKLLFWRLVPVLMAAHLLVVSIMSWLNIGAIPYPSPHPLIMLMLGLSCYWGFALLLFRWWRRQRNNFT